MSYGKTALVIIGGVGLVWYLARRKAVSADPALVDPHYMLGDTELPYYTWSTDDVGGTGGGWYGPIGQRHVIPRDEGPSRRDRGEIEGWGQNYPFYTGGTFLHPEYLPPVRYYQLQGAGHLV